MAVETAEKFLEHYGVKGMKWGVRQDKGHEGEQAKTKTIAKLDKKYEKSFSGMGGYFKIHNEVAGEMNKRLDGLNEKFKDVDHHIDKPDLPGTKAYLKEYEGLVEQSVKSAMDNFGTNASGTGRVKITRVGEGQDAWFQAEWEDLRHADSGGAGLKVVPKYQNGKIIGQTISVITDEEELKHMDETDEFLEHFGIKGMKWGKLTGGKDGVGPGAPGSAGGAGGSDRARNRALNKASREKDKAEARKEEEQRKADVLAARDRIYNGPTKDKLDAAKAQYQKDKVEVGSREARKALNKVKEEAWEDTMKANEYLNGKEFAKDLIVSLATVPLGNLGTVIDAAARNRTIKKSVKNY